MIDEHELIVEDVAALALGALDEAARARVEAHLQTCADCRQLLAEYRAVAGVLPFGGRPEQPPATAWAGIESRIRPVSAAAIPSPLPLRPRTAPWFARPRFLLVAGSFAAAALVLGVFLLAQAIGGSSSNQASLARKSTTNQAALSAASSTATSASRPAPVAASAAAAAPTTAATVTTAATSAAAATTGAATGAAASSPSPAAAAATVVASPASTVQGSERTPMETATADPSPGAQRPAAAGASVAAPPPASTLVPADRTSATTPSSTPVATGRPAGDHNVLKYAALGALAGVLLLCGGYTAFRMSRSRARSDTGSQ